MESLTLEQAYYVAEILGVLSIVISLIYVAIQIRQNTMAIRSDTAQSIHNNWGEAYGRLSSNMELTGVLMKGNAGIDRLTDEEKVDFIAYWMETFLTFQNAYYQFKSGTFEGRLWHTMERTLLSAMLSSPGCGGFWEARKPLFDDEFRHYVDTELTQRSIPSGYKMFGVKEPILNR